MSFVHVESCVLKRDVKWGSNCACCVSPPAGVHKELLYGECLCKIEGISVCSGWTSSIHYFRFNAYDTLVHDRVVCSVVDFETVASSLEEFLWIGWGVDVIHSYTLIPARFPRIEGPSSNVSERHNSRSSWLISRTIHALKLCFLAHAPKSQIGIWPPYWCMRLYLNRGHVDIFTI